VQAESESTRASNTKRMGNPYRIRGRKLQTLRRTCFQRNPLCAECERNGIVRAATQRDHRIALCNGGQDTEDNVQGLCDQCHAAKTAKDMGYNPKPVIGIDGWPV
jgi:5-methylcytosine-specific restriction protein A